MQDQYLEAALDEARQGYDEGGIPIGSVLVKDGKIIARGRNKRVQEADPVTHAEIDCLRNAGRIGSFKGTVLYSTLMPCYLCAGAVVQFGIPKVVVGEAENFEGAGEWMKSMGVEVINLESDPCKEILRSFIEDKPDVWGEDIGE